MPKASADTENTGVAKRRGRPAKASSVAAEDKISKSPIKRTSPLGAKPAGITKKTAPKKRQALKEISNTIEGGDGDDFDDFDVLSEPNIPALTPTISPPKRAGRKAKAASADPQAHKPKSRRGAATSVLEDERVIPETQQELPVQSKLARTASAGTKKPPKPAKREIIPETQPDPMEVNDEPTPAEHERLEEPVIKPRASSIKPSSNVNRQRHVPSSAMKAGSFSDTERGGNDSSLRRKVGELTNKLEALELKYNNVRDLSVTDAETSFDKLKRASDEKSKAANELITSLRAEVKSQSAQIVENSALKEQIAATNSTNEALLAEKRSLQTSLTEANNEIKVLQAKVAAARSSATSIATSEAATGRVPGSAAKPAPSRNLLVGSAEAVKDVQKRILKEELYSDLTGLIVRDVKRNEEEGEEVYDCIQTGRNGTLHFHLTLSNPATINGASSTNSSTKQAYEDAEFQYTPLLDQSHDRDLIEILPDYLTEEICFPRSNAPKFYSRVVDCLTKKVEIVMEDEE